MLRRSLLNRQWPGGWIRLVTEAWLETERDGLTESAPRAVFARTLD